MRCTVNIEGCTPRHFFALAASRPPADQINCGAENARLRTSLTTLLASSKIGSRRRSMGPGRESHFGESHCGISNTRPCVSDGVTPEGYSRGYSSTFVVPLGVLEYPKHSVQHTLMPPKTGPFFCIYILLHFSTGFVVLICRS